MNSLSVIRVVCITVLAVLFLTTWVSASITTVPAGGNVYIGEAGLNISQAMGGDTSIAWFTAAAPPTSNVPDKVIDVTDTKTNFNVSPTDFVAYTGNWYRWPAANLSSATLALRAFDPAIDMNIRDVPNDTYVSGATINRGTELKFRITSNLYTITDRGIPGAPITVRVWKPDSSELSALVNKSGSTNSLTDIPVSTVPYNTLPLWDTGQSAYEPGTYTVRAECNINGMKDNYKNMGADYVGKTVSPSYTVTLTNVTGPPPPPSLPVKLIFIHHSTGENWLNDANGGLGIALRDNNYFVSDTNYGWGPGSIGSLTDIGNWYNWFRGPQSPEYLGALYNESGQYTTYSRMATDPGGPNRIVMFKSCFPNSALQGSPSDPVPAIEDNPLKGNSAGSEFHTVANAKGIYLDLLNYFRTKPDTLFIVITAPPLSDSTYAANARAFNQWLVNDWLTGYPGTNVFVFDFYNVLTTNGGDADTSDLGFATGNHHRWWNNSIRHDVNLSFNTSAYPSGDDHPTRAGNLKATAEFIPLLNYAYNRWAEGTGQAVANFSANMTSGAAPLTVQFYDNSTGSPTIWNWSFGDGASSTVQNPSHTYSSAGNYTVLLQASNAGGSNTTSISGYVTVFPRGDFNTNRRVDISDVTRVAYIVAGFLPEQLNADFDASGHVGVEDAARIAWYYVGRISEL